MKRITNFHRVRVSRDLNIKSPPRTMDDSCPPLLKSIRHKPHESNIVRNQRTAGKAAAVGFALGDRFALGPPDTNETYTENRKAVGYEASHDQFALIIMDSRYL